MSNVDEAGVGLWDSCGAVLTRDKTRFSSPRPSHHLSPPPSSCRAKIRIDRNICNLRWAIDFCINFRIKRRWAATCKYHAICHFKISDTIETSSRDGDPFKILLLVSLWVSYQGHFMTWNRNIVFDATVKFYRSHFYLFDKVSQFELANKHSCGFQTSFFIFLPTHFLLATLTNCPFRCRAIRGLVIVERLKWMSFLSETQGRKPGACQNC